MTDNMYVLVKDITDIWEAMVFQITQKSLMIE